MDIAPILEACAAHGVAVEINANPWRLDLDWRWHERALELGCMMSINPDAHSTREIDLTHWGVEMARKGGVPAKRVLNCFTLPQLMHHLRKCRSMHARADLTTTDTGRVRPMLEDAEKTAKKNHGMVAAKAHRPEAVGLRLVLLTLSSSACISETIQSGWNAGQRR